MKKAFRRGLLPLILAAAMTVAASAWFVVSRSVTLADSHTAAVSITAEAVETGTGERYPITEEASILPAGTYVLTVKNDGDIPAAYVLTVENDGDVPAAYSLTVEDAAFSGDLETGRSDSAELTCYQSAWVSVTPLWSAESGHSLLDGHIVVGEAPSQPEVTGESSGTGE